MREIASRNRVSSTGDCGRLRRVTGCELSVRGRSAGAFELRVASRVSSTGVQRLQSALGFVNGRLQEITCINHTHGPGALPRVRSTAPHTRPQAPRMDPVCSYIQAPGPTPGHAGSSQNTHTPSSEDTDASLGDGGGVPYGTCDTRSRHHDHVRRPEHGTAVIPLLAMNHAGVTVGAQARAQD